MKEALIIMAILGCADDNSQCQTVQRVTVPFETVADCRAAQPAVLEKLTMLDYPVIVADCQRSPVNQLADARPIG
ncbi:hypothetical protein ACFOMD_08760 [Sphingoaurantiacus capsulatus]|uniref:Lipoprotein n=1 Tax=Sphingoaurantiacus capsulatus TaxID=1771310 RepID=A0ABV7XBL4_9SPHN